MADHGMSKEIRRRLYAFARGLASPFTDSRRQDVIENMIPGLLLSGHVHLTKVARAISPGDANPHRVEKRLSTPLSSEHWDMSPLADTLLSRSAQLVSDDTLLTAALTDLAKPYARQLEELGELRIAVIPTSGSWPATGSSRPTCASASGNCSPCCWNCCGPTPAPRPVQMPRFPPLCCASTWPPPARVRGCWT